MTLSITIKRNKAYTTVSIMTSDGHHCYAEWRGFVFNAECLGHQDTQHNDIQHNNIQHNGLICDTQHNNALPLCRVLFAKCRILFIAMQSVILLSVGMLSVVMLSVVSPCLGPPDIK
jgi:hypothetical protein